jgi:hypothetical protein
MFKKQIHILFPEVVVVEVDVVVVVEGLPYRLHWQFVVTTKKM